MKLKWIEVCVTFWHPSPIFLSSRFFHKRSGGKIKHAPHIKINFTSSDFHENIQLSLASIKSMNVECKLKKNNWRVLTWSLLRKVLFLQKYEVFFLFRLLRFSHHSQPAQTPLILSGKLWLIENDCKARTTLCCFLLKSNTHIEILLIQQKCMPVVQKKKHTIYTPKQPAIPPDEKKIIWLLLTSFT